MISAATLDYANECPICLKDCLNQRKMVITECKHAFHEKCITTWLDNNFLQKKQQTCPLCRENPLPLMRALEGKARKMDKNQYVEHRLESAIRKNDMLELENQLAKNPSLVSKPIYSTRCGTKFTPLGMACAYQSLEVVKALIEAGADINGVDVEGCTPLMLAARSGAKNAVDELLQQKANVHIKDKLGFTCVFLIDNHPNNVPIAEKLIAHGANIHVASKKGATPLMVAASNGDLALVKFFHAHGVDLDARGKSKLTALAKAVKNNHTEVVKYLLEAGANPNLRDKFKQSALFFAVHNQNMEITKALLKHKTIDVNLRTSEGLTPLYIAARDGLTSFVEILLEYNADPSLGYKFHFLLPPERPLEAAKTNNYREIVELLTLARKNTHQ